MSVTNCLPTRIAGLAALCLLPLLAACSSEAPPPASSSLPSASAVAADVQPAPSASAQPQAARPDALQPVFGTWALSLDQCDKQVLKISATRFDGPQSGCDINGFTDNGDGTYTAAMTCKTGDKTGPAKVRLKPVFAPTGEGIEITYLDANNQTSLVLRCDG
jgi:hypothetical protein